jgi:hypothetical protein
LKEEQDIGEEKSSQFQMPNSQSSRKGREKIKPLKDPNAPPQSQKKWWRDILQIEQSSTTAKENQGVFCA